MLVAECGKFAMYAVMSAGRGALTEVEEDVEERDKEGASAHSRCGRNRAGLHTDTTL